MTRVTPSRLLLALAAVFAVLLLPASPALAHNGLAEATPAKNAKLTKAPTEVKLRFLQKLDPAATTITVAGAEVSEPEVDGATATVSFTTPPANGDYTVAYEVSSRDGHKVKGSYRFTVAAPVPVTTVTTPPTSSAPAPSPTTATATVTPVPLAADQDKGGLSGAAIAGIVIAALAAIALLGLLIMRKRRQA